MKICFKVCLFVIIFFVLSLGLAFFLKDDANSYSRALTHSFYKQDNIDILFCGASHVSHGIDTRVSDLKFNCNTFNAGTPSQGINGTYAIIQQAIKTYKVKKIFLECDFAITCKGSGDSKKMGKSDFIVLNFLKDSSIKFNFTKDNSSANNMFNAFLPIGVDKLMTLSPSKLLKKTKALISGEYFKYNYGDKDSGYDGKGCVLDYDFIENGTFNNDIFEPAFKPVSEYWKNYIGKIIALCKEHDIELVFYSMPGSDFYLHEKGDYDTFYSEIKSYLNRLGFDYYDFNLCRPAFSMEDKDYSDDNHLNINGIQKFSNYFCNLFTGKVSEEDMFYSSYKEKIDAQEDKIYGLLIIKAENAKSFKIYPVKNNVSESDITYDVAVKHNGIEEVLAQNSPDTVYNYPEQTSGKLYIKSYIRGALCNSVSVSYAAF